MTRQRGAPPRARRRGGGRELATAEVAGRLGCTEGYVRRLLRDRGSGLAGHKDGAGDWKVWERDLEAYEERRRQEEEDAATRELITFGEAARLRGVTTQAMSAMVKRAGARGALEVVVDAETGERRLRRSEVLALKKAKPGPKPVVMIPAGGKKKQG